MAEKSTIKTSRKIYALHVAFRMLMYFAALYTIIVLCGYKPSDMIFGALIGAITGIVSTLNIADGMKNE